MYKKSFNQVDNEMCQRRQKSVIEVDLYGERKLVGNLNPNNKATPIAISEYPEKSKYICKIISVDSPDNSSYQKRALFASFFNREISNAFSTSSLIYKYLVKIVILVLSVNI